MELVKVDDLRVRFKTARGCVRAVNGVSFSIGKGHVLGVTGESGSGKTITASSIVRMVDAPNAVTEGAIWFEGENILSSSWKKMKQLWGKKIFMIFQSPSAALNPTLRVSSQLAEIYTAHYGCSWKTARKNAFGALQSVGIGPSLAGAFPFQLSGGMRQRVLIAMAIALKPMLLIADEPTAGLDNECRGAILNMLRRMNEKEGTSILLITHEMEDLRKLAGAVAVMHHGRIVERGAVDEIITAPRHVHTRHLIGDMRILPGR